MILHKMNDLAYCDEQLMCMSAYTHILKFLLLLFTCLTLHDDVQLIEKEWLHFEIYYSSRRFQRAP